VIAAVIAALYPNLWIYEREVMSETLVHLLVSCALLVSILFWQRPRLPTAALLGALCGLLALTRGEQLFLALVLLVPLCLLVDNRSWSVRFAGLGMSLVTFTAVLMPWVAYNMSRFEAPVFLTANTGEALRISNCDATYSGTHLGYFSGDCRSTGLTGDPSERDRQKRADAVDYIERHTRRLPIVVLAREGRTWGVFRPWQQSELDTVRGTDLWVTRTAMIAYWALVPFAVIGLVSGARRRLPVVVLVAFMATAAIGTALTFGQTRYRAAAEVPIVVAASVGIDAVSRRKRPLDRRDATAILPATDDTKPAPAETPVEPVGSPQMSRAA
jgi:4-amino-4-deoxy-L-arabinose transferase-like glycosyltransferase